MKKFHMISPDAEATGSQNNNRQSLSEAAALFSLSLEEALYVSLPIYGRVKSRKNSFHFRQSTPGDV